MTIFIEVPGSAATVHDLHAPMIIGARDCERKRNDRRHDHAAKHSTKKRESHFVPFDHPVIEARLPSGLALCLFIANRVMERCPLGHAPGSRAPLRRRNSVKTLQMLQRGPI